MLKLILSYCIYIAAFFTSLSAQSTIWRGFVSSTNGMIEPNELTCDIIKNGELRIAPLLSEQSDYWSNFTYLDTVCLSRNFSLEVRLKNNATIGGINGFDSQINFFSNGLKTSVVLAGAATAQSNTLIKIADSTVVTNQPLLVTNLNDWRVVKLSFFDNVFKLYLDGVEIYKTNHARRICNLDILKFAFKGGGALDWVKIYDNNNALFWTEEFNDCKTLTQGIICDPFRLDKSITISRPCENDTLSLIANFPAMSYRWSIPPSRKDTNKIARLVNPPAGQYDLTANVNICFDFFKSFDISITPVTTVTRTIRLCAGQSYKLSNGKTFNTDGTYRDTLKTKTGCDSIVVVNLTFDTPPLSKTSISICSSSYTLPSGRVVSSAGVYRDTSKNVNGCITIYEITLSTGTNFSMAVTTNLCEGQIHTLPNGRKVNAAGTYRDTLKSLGGCDSIIVTQLAFKPKPKITFEISKVGELFEGEKVSIKAISENGNYSWFENMQPLPRNSADIPITVKGGETMYKLVLNAFGCEVTDSIKIIGLSEIKMPNAFTPNNDGINDFFTMASKSGKVYKIVKFNVFNRQGKLVYNDSNSPNGWDGTYNGEELISDAYVYLILLESPAGKAFKFSGEVMLIR